VRVLVDTNILLSAMWFKNSRVANTLLYVANNHEMILCDRNIAEMRNVIKRKTPDILADAEVFLAELSYELIPSVEKAEKLIRDPKDQPILNAAFVSGIDVILTGDKDFLSLDIDSPKPMTVAQFLEFEGVEL
jgi:putative PIN family toxin of toxin-antitoxin system